jgi:hypothetical protein
MVRTRAPEGLRRVGKALREVGVRGTAQKVVSKIDDYWFDLRHGTDTCRWTALSELQVQNSRNLERAYDYQPTGNREFRRLMTDLAIPWTGEFVDFGAGKGRVVLMASTLGFSRTVGVEFSPYLCTIARRNVDSFTRRRRRGCPVEIVECDAVDYALSDDETVLFMFNPFDEVVAQAVLRNVEESLWRKPRKMWLIYSNASCNDVVEASAFAKTGEYRYPRARFVVYTNKPPG